MRHDASPTFGLFIAVIAGAISASKGRSAAGYGALACVIFFLLWDLLSVSSSTGSQYAAAMGVLALNAVLEGAVWGAFWGFAGGVIGRKVPRRPPRADSIAERQTDK